MASQVDLSAADPPAEPASETAAEAPSGKFDGLAPFASVSYRYLFIGTMLTMTGNFMQQVAQGWLIYDLTDSPTWLGLVSFARGIPMLFFALPAGVIVDRFDRRTVMIVAQGLTALVAIVLAALIALGVVQPWHVALTAFLGGCLFVLIIPSRQALVPTTVERPLLGRAIALMSTGQNAGRVIGPALAGILIAALGVAMSFAVQAAGFVLALFCAFMLGPRPLVGVKRQFSAVQSLLEGLHYVWSDTTVLALVALQAIPSAIIMPYTQLLPIFARDILGMGPEGLGTLMMANGIGSVVGAAGMVMMPSRRQGPFLFGSLAMFGLLLTLFALSTSFTLSLGLMGLMGIAQATYLATNQTLVHLATPDDLRGRVMSVYMMSWGLMPLGSLFQGVMADLVGAPVVAATAGLLSMLVVVVVAWRAPKLRRL